MRLSSSIKYLVDGDKIILKGVIDGELQFIESPWLPYAFVEEREGVEQILKLNEYVVSYEKTDLKASDTKRPVIMFKTANPKHIPLVREELNNRGYRTYESDIPYIRRLLFDDKLKVDYSGRVVYLDIEVDDSQGFPKEYGKYQIVSIAVYDADGTGKWFYVGDYNNELEMLTDFVYWLRENGKTVIVGWNVQFDWNHLNERLRYLKLRDSASYFEMTNMIDLMEEYKQAVKGLSSYSLEEVSIYEGFEKIKYRNKMIHEMTRQELYEYNMYDAELLYIIDKKYGFSEVRTKIAELVNLPLDDISSTRIGDSLIVRRLRELGYVMIDKKKYKDERYQGAVVLEPVPGLYKYVGYYDVNSLYPNVIIHKNIDIDGFNGEVLPYIEKALLDARAKFKKMYKETKDPKYDVMQKSYKILANSLYGLLGTASFRYYNKDKAAAITGGGREVLMKIKDYVEKELGLKILYGDSVAKDSMILVRRNGRIEYIPIEELFDGEPDYIDIGGKEYKFLSGVETITLDENGRIVWKPIKYVMRHKTNKKMYRMWLTNYWWVDVTEDHGVFGYVNVLERRNMSNIDKFGIGLFSPIDFAEKRVKFVVVPRKNIDNERAKMLGYGIVEKRFEDKEFMIQSVKKVEEIEYNDYVYDIEVEDTHRFFANWVLVHNTDSCFISLAELFEAEDIDEESLSVLAETVADMINKTISPFAVKLEALVKRILFFKASGGQGGAKKRYIGLKFDGSYLVRGVELRRSDWSPLAKEVLQRVIDIVMKEGGGKKEVMEYLAQVKKDMYAGKYDEKLIISKTMSKSESEYKNLPQHIKAYKKAVEAGYDFPDGRVRFVLAKGGEPEPVWQGRNIKEIRIDYDAYWEKQIMPPVRRVLESIGAGKWYGSLDKWFGSNRAKHLKTKRKK